jgi:hypothetical protein
VTEVINLGPLCGQLMSRTKDLVVYAGEHYVNPNGPEAALAIQRLAATVNAYGDEIVRLRRALEIASQPPVPPA